MSSSVSLEDHSQTSSATCNLSSLPSDILGVIDEFCKLRKLWMTCRGLWRSEVRRELIYLTLTGESSKRFLRDATFRNLVISSVVQRNKQISVTLMNCGGVTDVSSLGRVHTLKLSYCQGVTDALEPID